MRIHKNTPASLPKVRHCSGGSASRAPRFTLHAVVEALREAMAREVPDPKHNLGEVAYLLGHSDLSAFVRSFKRWTGTTPGEYRKSPA